MTFELPGLKEAQELAQEWTDVFAIMYPRFNVLFTVDEWDIRFQGWVFVVDITFPRSKKQAVLILKPEEMHGKIDTVDRLLKNTVILELEKYFEV